MKKQSVFNGLMVCILIAAMLPASSPLAARAAPEPLQEMKITRLSTTPDWTAESNQANAYFSKNGSTVNPSGFNVWTSIGSENRSVTSTLTAFNPVAAVTTTTVITITSVSDTIITRVSTAADGTEGNNYSGYPAISLDGRYVAFESDASNLVFGDTNDYSDIFVRDMQTGQVSRVSVSSDGIQSNEYSYSPSISADGRYVAFRSRASNFVPNDTNLAEDIFVHDRQTRQTTRVSIASNGTQANDGSPYGPAISADGRFVAFSSQASNLVDNDTTLRNTDLFVHDRQTGQTTLVSLASDGVQGNGSSYYHAISANGRYIAFDSNSSNLVNVDTNNASDVFVHDRQTGQTTCVSVASDGAQAQGGQSDPWPSISADGRYIAFDSTATNLVVSDTNGMADIFLHDQQTGQTTRISIAPGGTQANGSSVMPSISADGRYIAFVSYATNLVENDSNNYCGSDLWGFTGNLNCPDVFVHDRQTGHIYRISIAWDGAQSNGQSNLPIISGDGRYVAFQSFASNLVTEDTNNLSDIFRVFIPQSSPSGLVPLTGVTVTGPTTGNVNTAYTFTSSITPVTATTPITYSWQASGQLSITHIGSMVYTDSVSFTWTTGGTKLITVTAQNESSSVTATYTVNQISLHLIALVAFDNNLCPDLPNVIERFHTGTLNNPTVRATLLVDCDQVGDTRVLEIANGIITQTDVPTFTGELDTANPDVIAAFLTWARAQHPDTRTVVALLGHGAGLTPEIHSPRLSGEGPGVRSHVPPLPMSRDATPVDVTSGTYLSTPELGRALDAATNHGANPFDVLFLDQCFGGGLDTLVEIRDTASVFVASPNYAWGAFAYDRYLPHFTSTATPENIAQAIVDEYEAALDDTHPNAIFWLRGSDIVTITNAVSNLGDALRTAPAADVLAATLNSQFVDTTLCANDWQLCPPDEEIGLRSFAAQLQSRAVAGSAVHTAAGQVLTALLGVHSNTAHAAGAPWPKPESQWNLADLGPTVLAPLTKTLAASGVIWRASLYTSTVPLAATLSWSPTQTVMITTPWASTVNSGWARFLSSWYGPLTPTIGVWCNSLPPALVITGTESLTLTAQGGLVSARLTWTPVVTAADYAVYVLRPNDGTWELAASVPLTQTAFTHPDLPSGVYRYFVAARNDQGQAVARSDEAAIDVGVTSIDPGYGLNSVPTMAYLRGSGFEAPITVTMGSVALPDVLVIDPHTLHAVIPAGLTPGVYSVTVSTAAGQVVAPNAFRVINAVVVDDLVSSPDQLATNPLTVRAAHTTTIEFAFQRLGGKYTLDDVAVAIQVDGEVISNTWTEPVSPNSTVSASPVSWSPPISGTYQVCAIIDPANLIPESDETNNTICNTITVLPPGDDTIPPVVDGFVIDHGAPIAAVLTTTLTVTATDPLPNPSGVKCVKFYEYEWSQGVRRWLPLVRSSCVDYAATPSEYPWQLLNIPGIRYMTAWAQDNAGNISLAPGIDTINLMPAEQAGYVAQNGVIFYRFYVRQGQPVVVSLTSVDGDADLYVWGPGDQLWYSNNQAGLEDRVAFNAPITGTYQIEVHGYTAAHYRLTFGSVQPGMPSSLTAPIHNTDKPVPTAPAVPLDSCPNGRCARPPDWPFTTPEHKVYLPIVRR